MSTVFTMAVLQSRNDIELQTLFRMAQQDLTCSAPETPDRRNALATLKNITRVMIQRRMQPRPPSC
jgi:hypothetical protein